MTLMELIVAAGIFTTVTFIAVNLFVTASGVQKRIASTQRIQEDMRYVVEAIAQQVRLGSIDYAYYQDPNVDANYADAVDLHPSAASRPSTLALLDQSGTNFVLFSLDVDKLKYCSRPDRTSACAWLDITPEQVSITRLEFMIMPSADPFANPSSLACLTVNPCAGQCQSYRWDNTRCEYYSDGHNFQPKVRIVMEARGSIGQPREQGNLSLETIVSTRQVQVNVINTNYD